MICTNILKRVFRAGKKFEISKFSMMGSAAAASSRQSRFVGALEVKKPWLLDIDK